MKERGLILSQLGNLLKELKIFNSPKSERVRVGSDNDGGYVLLNDGLESIEVIYSYGVGDNSEFEAMFCEKYNAIARLYDHTVDSPPLEKSFFYFKKEGVGQKKTKDLNTIENHLNENGDTGKRLLLKMDVEGGEWDALIHTPSSVIGLFDQIVIEVHGLGTDLSESWLDKKIEVIRKLNELFYLYHVHANNFARVYYINWYKVPNVLELTFVNKKLFKNAEYSKVIFPTEFDRPNDKNKEDKKLYFFPFYPGVIQHVSDIVRRNGWKGWRDIIRILHNRLREDLRSIRTIIGLRRN